LETLRFYLRARAQQAPAERQALLDKAKAAQASNAAPQDFAGKWNIVIQSPVGPQHAVMELKVSGNVVTGVVTADQGAVNVAGSVANGRVKLEGKASMPMPITIKYDMTVRNGELSGDNANGPFGTFPVLGRKS
jgi:quinohemoprotein ethanol dehydrogenase